MIYVNVPQEDWSLGMAAVVHLRKLIGVGWKEPETEGDPSYRCFYCGARHQVESKLMHELDCPWAAAKALLESREIVGV